jgi:glycosyltransferase involved in cell wall biosynthesis
MSGSLPSPLTGPLRGPSLSVVIPTRDRPDYLAVALGSIVPQAAQAGAEVLVVDDGARSSARRVAESAGARYVALGAPRGLNAARNTGLDETSGDLVAFVDDDVEAQPGWLDALVEAARAHPDIEVFAGRIRARIEDHPLRSCGREGPPITFLDLGDEDRKVPFAWGANMTIRRSAFDRVGRFDPAHGLYGDEQEWQERLHARGEIGRAHV